MSSQELSRNCTIDQLDHALATGGSWQPISSTSRSRPAAYTISGSLGEVQRRAVKQAQHENITSDVYTPAMLWEWLPPPTQRTCTLSPLTRASLCASMRRLNLSRVFFIGDSLSHMMATSLYALTNHTDDISWEQRHSGARRTVHCDADGPSQPFTFALRALRDDSLVSTKWFSEYAAGPSTLLLANTGLHHRSLRGFQTSLAGVMSKLEGFSFSSNARQHDRIVFRTSVPGHANCSAYHAPVAHPLEITSAYQWDLVPSYNVAIYAAIANSSRILQRNGLKNQPDILDVMPMTLLRPDGHRTWIRPADCLHYALPGVPDWWNHALQAKLDCMGLDTESLDSRLSLEREPTSPAHSSLKISYRQVFIE